MYNTSFDCHKNASLESDTQLRDEKKKEKRKRERRRRNLREERLGKHKEQNRGGERGSRAERY